MLKLVVKLALKLVLKLVLKFRSMSVHTLLSSSTAGADEKFRLGAFPVVFRRQCRTLLLGMRNFNMFCSVGSVVCVETRRI